MKRFFGVFLGMALSSAAFAAPAPSFGTVRDGFDINTFAAIDNGAGTGASGQEVILVSKQTTAPGASNINSGFSWGGCTTSTAAAGTNFGSLNFGTADFMQFNKEAGVTGTYAYTRFDIDNTDGNNTPSVVLNCTNPGASIVLDVTQTLAANRFAVLVRDDVDWWQSSDQPVAATGAFTFDLATAGALTWTRIDDAAGTAGEDMNEVDASGEMYLTNDANQSGAPNLGAVEGVGIVATSMATGTAVKAAITTLTINAPDLAGVEDWSTR